MLGSTHEALYLSIRCTRCSGRGRAGPVSMALAKGWMSSGQLGSNSHNAEPQARQNRRSPDEVRPMAFLFDLRAVEA